MGAGVAAADDNDDSVIRSSGIPSRCLDCMTRNERGCHDLRREDSPLPGICAIGEFKEGRS